MNLLLYNLIAAELLKVTDRGYVNQDYLKERSLVFCKGHGRKKSLTVGRMEPSPPSMLPSSGTLMPCSAGEGVVGKVLGVVADSGSLPSVRPGCGGFMGPKGSVCTPRAPEAHRTERIKHHWIREQNTGGEKKEKKE